jgi:uncharacterized protein (TIGR03435 family)
MFIRPAGGGGLRITGASLRNLISLAYNVRPFQVSGGPQWMDTDRFDIEARATTSDGDAAPDPARAREEQRQTGERLQSLLSDRFQLQLYRETREQPVYALVVARGGSKLRQSPEANGLIRMMSRGTLRGEGVAVGMLTLNLSNELARRVIDKTGLTGKYDFELKWMPAAAGPQAAEGDPERPSLFTALQEQLGLRLESEKGPVEVLVIERVERPSGN